MKLLIVVVFTSFFQFAIADVYQNQLLSSDYSKSMLKHSQLLFKQDQEKYITYLNQSFDYQVDANGHLQFNEKEIFADKLFISKESDTVYKINFPAAFKPENFSVTSLNEFIELEQQKKQLSEGERKKKSSEDRVEILPESRLIKITLTQPKKYFCFSFENNFSYFRSCVSSDIVTTEEKALSRLSTETPDFFLNKAKIENQGTVLLQNISEPVDFRVRYKDQVFMNWIVLKRYPLFLKIDRDFENKKYVGSFYDFTLENFVWKADLEEQSGFFILKNNDFIDVKQDFALQELFFKNKEKSLKFSLLRIKKKTPTPPVVTKKEKKTQFNLVITNSSFKKTDDLYDAQLFSKMNLGFVFSHEATLWERDWIFNFGFDQFQILDSSDSIIIQGKSSSLLGFSVDNILSSSENLIFAAGGGLQDHIVFSSDAITQQVNVAKVMLPQIEGLAAFKVSFADDFLLVLPLKLAFSLGGSADGQKYSSAVTMSLGYRIKYIDDAVDYIFGGETVLSTRTVNNFAQKNSSGKVYFGVGYDF